MRGLKDWLTLVRFSHSIFALPFALSAAWLAERGAPSLSVLALIVVAAVAARTAALGFNRIVDRFIDAANPRTADRELPSGKLSPRAVWLLVILSSAIFLAAAAALNSLCGWLAPLVLLVLLGYSLVKRVSWMAHAALGLALALAPLGAWLAVTGDLSGDLATPLLLAAAVLTWVFGFDLIYACQDAEHDRRVGLFSIPARFGVARALSISTVAHGLTAVLLLLFGLHADLGPAYWGVFVVAVGLLVWQHRIVSPEDLSRLDAAFFTLNGWVGVALFFGLVLDLQLAGGAA